MSSSESAPMLLSAPADIVALVIGAVVLIDLLKPKGKGKR